jgi:hypothetical protein
MVEISERVRQQAGVGTNRTTEAINGLEAGFTSADDEPISLE